MSKEIVGKVTKWYYLPCDFMYAKDDHAIKPYLAMISYSYYSKRYKKWITVKPWKRSDGATGALDIESHSWWVHDEACDTGQWDDGTPMTNWQASRVLSDILWSEGRYFRAGYWLAATFLLGGGKSRDNGLFMVKSVGKVTSVGPKEEVAMALDKGEINGAASPGQTVKQVVAVVYGDTEKGGEEY